VFRIMSDTCLNHAWYADETKEEVMSYCLCDTILVKQAELRLEKKYGPQLFISKGHYDYDVKKFYL
jgi:hypothetical protein